jgi:hypothetical protein
MKIQELTQWLAEIKALKQQLAEMQQDLNAVNESAISWQRLYNTEAQQRRTENYHAQQQIAQLKQQIQSLSGLADSENEDPIIVESRRAEVAQLQTVAELQAKLTEVMGDRDRLIAALKTEQENHIQTRKSLTTAIGDTLDILTKERQTEKFVVGL